MKIWGMGELIGLLDGPHPDGEKRTRSRVTNPYDYDPFVIWQRDDIVCETTVYSDRLWQWNPDTHDRLCEKYFGDRGQYWSKRDPEAIELFLREYNDEPTLQLGRITEYCNVSNGYPCWRFDYTTRGLQPKDKAPRETTVSTKD